MTEVFLVRHGATEWNAAKRAQGQADIPLTSPGLRQAQTAASRLVAFPLDGVYSSDLIRAADTARVIAEPHGREVVLDPDLREIDQGEWEGLHISEIAERWPELWGPARHYRARPGGEAPADVRRRALRAVVRMTQSHPHGRVAAVSHGGTIRWISAEVLGYDDEQSARIRGLGNGGIVSFRAALNGDRLLLDGLRRLDGKTTDLDDPND